MYNVACLTSMGYDSRIMGKIVGNNVIGSWCCYQWFSLNACCFEKSALRPQDSQGSVTIMESGDRKTYQIPKALIAISVAALAAVFVFSTTMPVETANVLGQMKTVVTVNMGSLFVILVTAILIYDFWLIFSKYGEIRLGKSKPLYGTFGWVAMIFCATMGSSILYWASVEWMYNVTTPPMNLEPLSRQAYEMAMPYSFFHWGLPAWGVYAVGVIPFAYSYYVRRREGLKLEKICDGVLGKYSDKLPGQIIAVIFIFATLGGTTLTFGSGMPIIVNLVHNLFGAPLNSVTYLLLIGIVALTFTLGTISGLHKGIQFLSKLASYICLAILLMIFLFGHGLFIIENTIQSLGLLTVNFTAMITNLDTIGRSRYPQDWSVFYWAWWIALAPVMWIFFAKISSGRRIKDVVMAVLFAGTAGSVLFFGIIGNHGIYEQLFGGADILKVFETQGDTQAVYYALSLLPFSEVVFFLLLLAAFFLLVTTLDSIAYTLSANCIKNIKAFEPPPQGLRIVWSILITIIPISLFYTQAGMNAFQSVTIMTAIPIAICIVMVMISCSKWLLEDYKDKTRQEIIDEYKLGQGPGADQQLAGQE